MWGITRTDDAQVVAGSIVSQRVRDDLVSRGQQPTSVNCGNLEAEVGATTYCETPGLSTPGYTIRVTSVQGSTVSSWAYE